GSAASSGGGTSASKTPATGGSAASASLGPGGNSAREAVVAAKVREIASLRQQIDELARRPGFRQELVTLRAELARAEADLVPLRAGLQPVRQEMPESGPRVEIQQIQFIQPEVFAPTRDIDSPPVRMLAGSRGWLVVGRVASDAGLKS